MFTFYQHINIWFELYVLAKKKLFLTATITPRNVKGLHANNSIHIFILEC
jgi:hypothetical protein